MSMLKKPLARILIVSSFLFLLGVAALAAAGRKNGIVLSADHRTTIATHPSGHVVAPPSEAGLTLITGNLSRYPFGVYFCCYGGTISGPNSQIGATYWDAIPFTPSTNVTASKLQASVGFVSGANSVALSLNSDNGGLPGTVLATADASNLGTFGTCCTLASVGGGSGGIALTAGTQYWVVVYTDTNSQTSWDAWAYNTTDMRNYPYAFYDNGVWLPTQGVLPGYALYGH
jgi:hypothetical protein